MSRVEACRAILAQAPAFTLFLKKVIGKQTFDYLKKVSDKYEIYLFSGIIRDFLIGEASALTPRDIDLVIKGDFNTSFMTLCTSLLPRKNSFKGVKLTFQNMTVDVWNIKDTWGIKHHSKKVNINSLLESAFFNFSTIVYSFKDSKFIFDDAFVDFLMNRRMEVVMPENPNIGLSLFNIYYYSKRLDVKIGTSVVRWIEENFSYIIDYQSIQRKHLGEAIVPSQKVIEFLIKLKNSDVQNRLE